MSLKISLCNKSLIKSDMKRYWWISALYTLAVFFSLTFNLIRISKQGIISMPKDYSLVNSYIYSSSSVMFALSIFVPVVLGVLLFSYLQSGKSVTTMHSVPITRKTQYLSHFLSGIILFTIPLAVNVLLMMLFRINGNFASVFRISHLADVMIITFIYSILTYSASCAVSMITGSKIAAFVFTYVFGLLPVEAEGFSYLLARVLLYGFYEDYDFSVSQFLYVMPHNLLIIKNIVLYVGISIIFAFSGYLLYEKRKLEKHGEVVAFSFLNPVFIFGVGLCSGAVGYAYFYGVWDLKSIFWFMPFGILGIIIAEMLVRKSFKVFSCYKKIIGYSAFVLVLFLAFKFDISGYEKRVPDANDVESVVFDDCYYNSGVETRYGSDGIPMFHDSEYDISITDGDLIEKITKYHKLIVSEREDPNLPDRNYVSIFYKLKNGKSLKRGYYVDVEKNKDYLRPILESDEVKSARFPILRNDDRKIVSVYINDYRIDGQTVFYEDDTEMIENLKKALTSDIKNASYEDYYSREYSPFVSISFETKKPSHYSDGSEVPYEKLTTDNENYLINRSYKNTYNYLESIGFFDSLPTFEDVSSVFVEDGYNGKYTETEITDPEQKKKIFDYCMKNENSGNDICVRFVIKDDYSFTCTLSADKLPDYITAKN